MAQRVSSPFGTALRAPSGDYHIVLAPHQSGILVGDLNQSFEAGCATVLSLFTFGPVTPALVTAEIYKEDPAQSVKLYITPGGSPARSLTVFLLTEIYGARGEYLFVVVMNPDDDYTLIVGASVSQILCPLPPGPTVLPPPFLPDWPPSPDPPDYTQIDPIPFNRDVLE